MPITLAISTKHIAPIFSNGEIYTSRGKGIAASLSGFSPNQRSLKVNFMQQITNCLTTIFNLFSTNS